MDLKWGIFSKYRSEIYGLSILWIMVFHGLIIKKVSLDYSFQFLSPILKRGNLGVEVFLFLSGICLYYSMANNSDTWIFYKNRLKRILFPFLVIAGGYWFINSIVGNSNFTSFLKHITMWSFWVDGNSAEWFIALILPLYFIYPVIYHKIIKKNRELLLMLLIVLIYGILTLVRMNYNIYYAKVEIALSRIPNFILGCYCGKFVFENHEVKKALLYGWIALALIVWAGFFFKFYSLTKVHRLPYFFAGPLVSCLFCVLVERLQRCERVLAFLRFAGTISLELYLAHLTLRRLFIGSKYMGVYPPANFHEYVLLVIGGAFILSAFVHFFYKKISH